MNLSSKTKLLNTSFIFFNVVDNSFSINIPLLFNVLFSFFKLVINAD